MASRKLPSEIAQHVSDDTPNIHSSAVVCPINCSKGSIDISPIRGTNNATDINV